MLREPYVYVTNEAHVSYESTIRKTGCVIISLRLCYGAETCTYAAMIFIIFEPFLQTVCFTLPYFSIFPENLTITIRSAYISSLVKINFIKFYIVTFLIINKTNPKITKKNPHHFTARTLCFRYYSTS